MVVVLVTVPVESRPVTINRKGPPGLRLGLTFSVRVDVAEPFVARVTDAGLKLAVTLDGTPLTLSVTLPEKDPAPATVMVLVPLLPRLTVRLAGLALRLIVPAGVTTSVTFVEDVAGGVVLVPLTVSV